MQDGWSRAIHSCLDFAGNPVISRYKMIQRFGCFQKQGENPPKWMVYNQWKTLLIKMDDLGGKPIIFGNIWGRLSIHLPGVLDSQSWHASLGYEQMHRWLLKKRMCYILQCMYCIIVCIEYSTVWIYIYMITYVYACCTFLVFSMVLPPTTTVLW